MLAVCFMCLFFRWNVRRTLASMELSGGRENLATKGRLSYLPLCKGDLFYLLSPVTLGHIDERFAKRRACEQVPVCSTTFFFVIPCFRVKVVLAHVGGWRLIGHQDVALGDLCLSLK